MAFLEARRAGLFRHRKRCPWPCQMELPLLMHYAAMADAGRWNCRWSVLQWPTERLAIIVGIHANRTRHMSAVPDAVCRNVIDQEPA